MTPCKGKKKERKDIYNFVIKRQIKTAILLSRRANTYL